jgi:hypothetical protein
MATPSGPPHRFFIPGRQAAIDHSARIDKRPFIISISILFGTAILAVLTRFAIRIFKRRRVRFDDGLVLIATMALIAAYGLCLNLLPRLYLVEAINKKKIPFPFLEEIPVLLSTLKWATIFAAMNWTSVYMVKFAFMYFFHPLIVGLSRRVTRFYWTTVVLLAVFWIYTVLNPVIICPHFGADIAKCNASPHQHAKSLTGNILVAVLDIICDVLIVAVPLVILNKSMMPFSQKASLAAMLCLSVAMIICALIRLIGSITDTRKDGSGTAPVWATYWAMVESCVSLIMTSVIVIRGVFITTLIKDDRQKQESILNRFGRRLLSTLRLSGSSGRSGRSRRSPQGSGGDNHGEGPSAPQIPTQGLTRGTLGGVRTFISGGKSGRKGSGQDDMLKSGDTAYILEDLDYHKIRKNEATKPTATPDSTRPGTGAPTEPALPGQAR